MPSRRRPVPAVVLAVMAAAALVGGCATGPAGGTATPAGAPPAASVAWADGFCGALIGFQQAAGTQPRPDLTSSRTAVRGLTGYIGTMITAIDTSTGRLKKLGPAPAPDGDAAVRAVTKALAADRATFQKARTQLAAADPNDPASVSRAVAPLSGLGRQAGALQGMATSPALAEAVQAAPTCQKLEGGS